MGTRSLHPDEAKRVREALERLIREAGTQRELARRLGVTPQALSRVVQKESPQAPGLALARKVADALGLTFEQLVGDVHRQRTDTARLEPKLANLAGWKDLEARARASRQWRHVPRAAWEAVGNLRTAMPPRHLTADWIGQIAADWARVLAGEGDETEEIRADMEADRRRGK